MKFSQIQLEAIEDLKKTNGWGIILEIANQIMAIECNLEAVDEKLEAQEFKVECLGRKKAKIMFKQIFDEIKFIDKEIERKKKDFS